MIKDKVLLELSIQREKTRTDFIFNDADNATARRMILEINALGYNFNYIAEIVFYKIPGSGQIVLKYVSKFTHEATRAYLISKMVSDDIQDCEKVVLDLYLHFKSSSTYISEPGAPAPAHIYVCYDNAFKSLKPKKIKNDLTKLALNPRDAFYLPFTMRMLASWKSQEMRQILMSYIDTDWITAEDVGICNDGKEYYPPLEFIRRELKFTAIEGLKYYPSQETTDVITSLLGSGDKDIEAAVKKILKYLAKKAK